MQLDWITVAAQIVNFLILVWLLHRFLYGPITRAMERREERIRSRLDDAQQQREKAEVKQRELDEALRKLADEREEKLERAREDAEHLKRELEREAREEVDRKREAWVAELAESQAEFLIDLRGKAAEEFRLLAEDALATLADTRITDRMAEVFLDRLRALDSESAEQLAAGAKCEGVFRVETGGELDAGLRKRMTRAIHETIAEGIEVSYDREVNGLVGIRLRGGSATVEWSIDDYIERFADELSGAFPKHAGAKPPSADASLPGDGAPEKEYCEGRGGQKKPVRATTP